MIKLAEHIYFFSTRSWAQIMLIFNIIFVRMCLKKVNVFSPVAQISVQLKHMQIYIMRHGQSKSNADKEVTGQLESPLTGLGAQQATLAGQKAKKLNIDFIFCSPLMRAQQTAKIVAEQIGYETSHIITLPGLAERGLGQLEGTSYALNVRMNGNYPEAESVPGVEPLEHLHGRVNHALRTILSKLDNNKNALIVCHMNIGRMLWVIAKEGHPVDLYDQPLLENGRIYPLLNQ